MAEKGSSLKARDAGGAARRGPAACRGRARHRPYAGRRAQLGGLRAAYPHAAGAVRASAGPTSSKVSSIGGTRMRMPVASLALPRASSAL